MRHLYRRSVLAAVAILSTATLFGCRPSEQATQVENSQVQQSPNNAPLTPVEIAQQAFKSVAFITLNDAVGATVAIGSGYVIANGLLVTNLHVVADGESAFVRLVGQERTYPVQGVVAFDEINDLALLAVAGIEAPSLAPRGEAPQIGERVYAVGNPSGLEGTFSEGIVSGLRDGDGKSLIQITAPISPGSSGGPVLDSEGRVIGVAVSTLRTGQNLNFAVPYIAVAGLVTNTGQMRPLSEFRPKRAERISTIDAIEGDTFLWSSSSFSGEFTLSLRNTLPIAVHNVRGCVVFYGESGKPIQFSCFKYDGIIPPGVASRAHGRTDNDTVRLTTRSRCDGRATQLCMDGAPFTKIDIRVIDFEVYE
jgi:hypothetical protein